MHVDNKIYIFINIILYFNETYFFLLFIFKKIAYWFLT